MIHEVTKGFDFNKKRNYIKLINEAESFATKLMPFIAGQICLNLPLDHKNFSIYQYRSLFG